jgi:hypothetical protein
LNVQNWPNSVITLFDFWGPGSGHKHAATLYAHPGRRFGSILLSRLTSSAAGEGRVRQQLTIFLHVLSASRQRLHSVVPSCGKHPTRVRTTFTKTGLTHQKDKGLLFAHGEYVLLLICAPFHPPLRRRKRERHGAFTTIVANRTINLQHSVRIHVA